MARTDDDQHTRLFDVLDLEGVDAAELDLLQSASEVASFRAGHALARQDDLGHEAFVILDGEVEALRDGRHLTVHGPGDVVGELAVLGGQRRAADLVARSDVDTVVFDVRSFQRAIHGSDRLRAHVEQAVIAHSVS